MSVVREIRASGPARRSSRPARGATPTNTATRSRPRRRSADRVPVDGPDEDVAAGLVGAEPEVGCGPSGMPKMRCLALVEISFGPWPVRAAKAGARIARRTKQPDERGPAARTVLLQPGPEELPGRAADDLGIGGLGDGPRGAGAPRRPSSSRGGAYGRVSQIGPVTGIQILPRLVSNCTSARHRADGLSSSESPAFSRVLNRGPERAARGVDASPRGPQDQRGDAGSERVPRLGRPLVAEQGHRTATTISAPVASWMRGRDGSPPVGEGVGPGPGSSRWRGSLTPRVLLPRAAPARRRPKPQATAGSISTPMIAPGQLRRTSGVNARR